MAPGYAKAHLKALGDRVRFGNEQMRLLVADHTLQSVLDALLNIFGAQPTARILVLAIEASLPRQDQDEGRT